MVDLLKFLGTIALIALVVLPTIKLLMNQAAKAAEAKRTGLALLLTSLQFIIFFGGFTLMIFFALAYISTKTNVL